MPRHIKFLKSDKMTTNTTCNTKLNLFLINDSSEPSGEFKWGSKDWMVVI